MNASCSQNERAAGVSPAGGVRMHGVPALAGGGFLRLKLELHAYGVPSTCLRTIGLLALLVGMSFSVSAAPAQTPASPTLEDISRTMSRADTVFSRFVQERHLSLFNEPLRSEGYLCFQKPGRVRWQTTQPYQSILVSDGSGVAQFEWVDAKWKKLDIGLANAVQNVVSQIAGVMEGRYASNKREYEVSLSSSTNGPVITLVPKHEGMRKMMSPIEVYIAPDLKATRRVVLRETGGDFTDIVFSEQVAGIELPAKTFDRAAPVDLEAIRKSAVQAKP